MTAAIDDICDALRARRLPSNAEAELQDAISDALAAVDMPATFEHRPDRLRANVVFASSILSSRKAMSSRR